MPEVGDTKFKPNNEMWKRRVNVGAKPCFSDADDMWNKAVAYFDWAVANPLLSQKIFNHQGEIIKGDEEKLRPFTILGMCNYIGITYQTWLDYRRNKEAKGKDKTDFSLVMDRIDQIIYSQKFEGASAGLLNPNIIARDLGLADKKEIEHKNLEFVADILSKKDDS